MSNITSLPASGSLSADAEKSDTVDLSIVTNGKVDAGRGIWVDTTAGAIKVTTLAGDEVTMTFPLQQVIPLQVTRVWDTDTSAVGIYILY